MNQTELLDCIKQAVRGIEPEAEIILFGYRLYELEWDCEEVLSSMVCSRQNWQTPLYQSTSFYKSIQKEGIML